LCLRVLSDEVCSCKKSKKELAKVVEHFYASTVISADNIA
jgi:hypothetical protein